MWRWFESAGAPARKGTAPRNSAPELCKGSEHSPCAHSTPVIGVVWPLSGRTACGAKQTSMVGELRLQAAQPAAQNRGSRHAARRHWNRGAPGSAKGGRRPGCAALVVWPLSGRTACGAKQTSIEGAHHRPLETWFETGAKILIRSWWWWVGNARYFFIRARGSG